MSPVLSGTTRVYLEVRNRREARAMYIRNLLHE